VTHLYEAHSQGGYPVKASVRFEVSWTATIGGRVIGPYSADPITVAAGPLEYPVEQAQPELIEM
jgi:hypothetical protein